jgi:hypothetical protein
VRDTRVAASSSGEVMETVTVTILGSLFSFAQPVKIRAKSAAIIDNLVFIIVGFKRNKLPIFSRHIGQTAG